MPRGLGRMNDYITRGEAEALARRYALESVEMVLGIIRKGAALADSIEIEPAPPESVPTDAEGAEVAA